MVSMVTKYERERERERDRGGHFVCTKVRERTRELQQGSLASI
jgi:hypothetical protein